MKPNLPYCTTKQAIATGVYSVYPILSGGDWSAVEQLKRMNRRTRNETRLPRDFDNSLRRPRKCS
jgi:hypothetical protein